MTRELEGAGWMGFLGFPLSRGRMFRVVATDHLQWDVMLFLFSSERKQESGCFPKFTELLLICDSMLMLFHFVQKHLSLSRYA